MTDTIAIVDTGTGDLEILMGPISVDPDLTVTILDHTLRRAPRAITLQISGGRPNVDFSILVDNYDEDSPTPDPYPIYTDTLDTEGSFGPISITVDGVHGGAQGDNTVFVHQLAEDGTTVIEATDTYHMARTPIVYPVVQGADEDPVIVPGAYDAELDIYHFVLQDLLGVESGGIGSWVWNPGPESMTSPHVEIALSSQHTTAHSGQFHVWQAGQIPKDWQLTGIAATQEMVEKLEQYAALNRRIWVIDEHNRAWICVIDMFDPVLRKRTLYNGLWTDWVVDYTMDLTILDQNWRTPV